MITGFARRTLLIITPNMGPICRTDATCAGTLHAGRGMGEQLEPRLGSDFGSSASRSLRCAQVTPGLLPAPTGNAAEVLCTGEVTIPEGADNGRPYRLVVAEYEEYAVDGPRHYDLVATAKDDAWCLSKHHSLAL